MLTFFNTHISFFSLLFSSVFLSCFPLLSSITPPLIFSPSPLPLCHFLSFPSLSSLSLRIPPLLVSSLISSLCFTSVLLACPFLSPAICLSNMAVPSQLGAFPGNKTSNTVPPQLNGPPLCFCHSRYMQRDKTGQQK